MANGLPGSTSALRDRGRRPRRSRSRFSTRRGFGTLAIAMVGGSVGVSPGQVWRSPPWSWPQYRRLGVWRTLLLRAAGQSPFTAWLAGWIIFGPTGLTPAGFAALSISAHVLAVLLAVLALGPALLLLASAASRSRRSIWSGAWWSANGASQAVLGLTTMACFGLACVAGYFTYQAPTDPFSAFPVFLVSPAAGAVGFLVAWICSNRDVKRTIRGGLAAGYWMSSDRRWWWDGTQWVDAFFRAPDSALRSPDEGYWWTGTQWIALPLTPRGVKTRQPYR